MIWIERPRDTWDSPWRERQIRERMPSIDALTDLGAEFNAGMIGRGGVPDPRIVKLGTAKHQFGDDDLRLLQPLPNLEVIEITSTQVTDAGIGHLSRQFAVRRLQLACPQVTDQAMAHLEMLFKLEELILNSTQVSDAALRLLPESAHRRLERLELAGTRVTDVGLANLRTFQNLQALVLDNTTVTDRGIERLRTLPLRILSLQQVEGLTDQGLEQLAEFSSLEELHLVGSKVTAEGVQKFKRARPNCQVHF